MVWNDNNGSVGMYMAALPYNEEVGSKVDMFVNEIVFHDFHAKEGLLLEHLTPLLPLFENGQYFLAYIADTRENFFQYRTSRDDFLETHYLPLRVQYADKITFTNDEKAIRLDFEKYEKSKASIPNFYIGDVLDYSTDNIYDEFQTLFATRPKKSLDAERIKHFESKIKEGERPFALVMSADYSEADLDSAHYILDGHHKLAAYQNLKIYPPIAFITRQINAQDKNQFDLEMLSHHLYSWQTEDIINHWDDEAGEAYILKASHNSTGNLQQFIKNGELKEYYENGKLKKRASYKHNKLHGLYETWHQNGQLEKTGNYNYGAPIGVHMGYHSSGTFRQKQNTPTKANKKVHQLPILITASCIEKNHMKTASLSMETHLSTGTRMVSWLVDLLIRMA